MVLLIVTTYALLLVSVATGHSKRPLDWGTRIQIAIDVAAALVSVVCVKQTDRTEKGKQKRSLKHILSVAINIYNCPHEILQNTTDDSAKKPTNIPPLV